jgi:hypothetical protein
MRIRQASALLTLVMLSACGDGSNTAGPGGVSVEDAQALDEAAARLDAEASDQPESNTPTAK